VWVAVAVAVAVAVTVTVAGAGAVTEAVAVVGRGDLRSPMWFGPRRWRSWVGATCGRPCGSGRGGVRDGSGARGWRGWNQAGSAPV
jgi:hypothetical protein